MAHSPTLPVPEQRGLRALALSGRFESRVGARRLVRLWHFTSLDAATVAVVWCVALGWAGRVALPPRLPLALGLCAWAFYIADRLLDARRSIGDPRASQDLRPRHYFHWRHRRILLPVAIAAALTAIALVFASLPMATLVRDSPIAAAAVAYVVSVHRPRALSRPPAAARGFFGVPVPKELLVAVVFTTACALPAWGSSFEDRGGHLGVPGLLWLCFVAVAWLNCHAIEVWESTPAVMAMHGRFSQATPLRKPGVFACAMWLAVFVLAAAAIAASMHQSRAAGLLCAQSLSAALLGLLDFARFRLTPTALRVSADLALLTPVLLLPLALGQ